MNGQIHYESPRFGVKGRAAAEWLTSQGVALPLHPNSWLADREQGRVLRLGRGEYLLEGDVADRMAQAWKNAQPDLYRVPRYDAAFLLQGEKVAAMLQEICALDTRPQMMGDQVLLTMAVGISVMLVCEKDNATPTYRLWCDATYGDYMQHILQDILN